MKKSLLSITDENSILITAEFLKDSLTNKVGENINESYKLDLIVKKDITVNQLLEAIKSGLVYRLSKYKDYPGYKDILRQYKDYMHKDAETIDLPDEEFMAEAEEFIKKKRKLSFLDEYRLKFLKKEKPDDEELLKEEYLKILEGDDEEKKLEDEKSLKEKEIFMYLHCAYIFSVCYSEYLKTSQDDLLHSHVYNRPSILISSMDYNSIEDGIEKSKREYNKLCLDNDKGSLTLKDLGFITTTTIKFDPIGILKSNFLLNSEDVIAPFKESAPHYNISDRNLIKLDDEPIQIISPSEQPKNERHNLAMAIITPLLMVGVMMIIRMFSGNSAGMASMGIMTACMGIVSALVAIVNVYISKKTLKKEIEKWRKNYQNYIRRLLEKINSRQLNDIENLHKLYPPVYNPDEDKNNKTSLLSKALEINGDIFSRGQEHPDFMRVRIGKSAINSELVPSVFEVKGDKKEEIYADVRYVNIKQKSGVPFTIVLPNEKNNSATDGSEGYLIDLPYEIKKQYEYLENAPVTISFKDCRSLGIVCEGNYDFQPFLSNMIFDLCFHQSPDDLQCVMFCEKNLDYEQQQKIIEKYKYLPHFKELLGDMSAFAFNKDDAYLIFNKLLEILSDRKEQGKDAKDPYILVFVLDEYDLKRHPVSEYFPVYGETEQNKNIGISFVFCERYTENLPKFCNSVIKRVKSKESGKKYDWFLVPHTQLLTESVNNYEEVNSRYRFYLDKLAPNSNVKEDLMELERYNNGYKTLSALFYERIAQGADVPSKVDLFDIIGDVDPTKPDELDEQLNNYIRKSWNLIDNKGEEKRTDKSLAVPIGKKASGVIELDLHEKADGPHMLVAGTTGSGKTETILTFLISLCANYTPEQVTLLLMDMKGAGFVQRIGDEERGTKLPHVVGTVTDIAGDEAGTGTAYMLKRFLLSMNAEVKRRKLLLNKMGVDSVDEYTKARMNPENHANKNSKMNVEDINQLPPLPHLFLIIDEFTELMKFSSDNDDVDFKSAITSLARIGRSLGFHIILISQNIENAITDDIRVNSRARLCLKVATREASKEMIQTDLAASPMMPGNGRAYLLVGTGSRFEYFQSGYSGTDITRSVDDPVVVTKAEMSGLYSLFYDSSKNEYTKLDNIFDLFDEDLENDENHSEDKSDVEKSIEDSEFYKDRFKTSQQETTPGSDDDESDLTVKSQNGDNLDDKTVRSVEPAVVESDLTVKSQNGDNLDDETVRYVEPAVVESDLTVKSQNGDNLDDETVRTVEPAVVESDLAVKSQSDDNLDDETVRAVENSKLEPKLTLKLKEDDNFDDTTTRTAESDTQKDDSIDDDFEFEDDDSDSIDAEKELKPIGITQLKKVVDQIIYCFNESGMEKPNCVFQQPLPNSCYYKYNWDDNSGKCIVLKDKNKK